MSVTIDMGDVQRNLKASPQIIREELRSGLDVMVARTESEVVSVTPRGVGGQAGLAGSIHGQVVSYGESYMGIVGTPLGYGEPVELGRRPGTMPPVGPIALWARRILGIPEKESRSVGFAIAMKIKQKGTKPAEMFGKTLKKLSSWYNRQAAEIGERIARRMGGR